MFTRPRLRLFLRHSSVAAPENTVNFSSTFTVADNGGSPSEAPADVHIVGGKVNLVGFPLRHLPLIESALKVKPATALSLLRQVHRLGVSDLSAVDGIGPSKRQALMDKFTVGVCLGCGLCRSRVDPLKLCRGSNLVN